MAIILINHYQGELKMKIVIAPDSFKESLTALEVAQAIENGFKKIYLMQIM